MFNFDKINDRRGTNSVKWDEATDPDVIPMWVADMDFETAPAITEALRRRVEHGIFGYTLVPDSYYESIINWFSRRHNWTIERSWIQYTTGVVPAISCAIKAMTRPGDTVIVLTPNYNCFFSSIRNNGCAAEEVALLHKGDSFAIDFETVERCCKNPKAKVLLFCNPHNPVGRVWTKEEMERLNDICKANGVVVISDEIHCELVMPGYTFIPFASVSEACQKNCITLNSPSKSFNIAGLQIANIICENTEWQKKIDRAVNDNEVCDVNPFGVIALQAAYNEGEEWLDALNSYLYGNYQALLQFFAENIPEVSIATLEGTYLVWADVSKLGVTADELAERMLKEGKVWMNSGTMYHDAPSENHIRINIACPRSMMLEGLRRMKSVI